MDVKNYWKRTLITFSVALNIGFIAAALVIYYAHPSGSHYRYLTCAEEIVPKLDLPFEQHEKLRACLEQLKEQSSTAGVALQKVQREMLTTLSAPGALDHAAFQEIYASQEGLILKKYQIFRDHLLKMRELLGNEKSVDFFSQLLVKEK